MRARELLNILNDLPPETDIVVSLRLEKVFYDGGVLPGVARIVDECRDIVAAEPTTEYCRCGRYCETAVPVLALRLPHELLKIV